MHLRKTMVIILCLSLLALTATLFTACGQTYTVKYSAGSGGTIRGTLTQSVEEGGSTNAVTAVPDEGYVFVTWSDGKQTATRYESNVKADQQLTALFLLDTVYTATYIPSLGGIIEGQMIQVVKSGGSATTVKAVALEGYSFVSWSDGVKTAERTDKNIKANFSVTANFTLNTYYTATYMAGLGGSIDGETVQLVEQGQDAKTVTAVPYEGYVFNSWSDGVKTAERTDTALSSNLSVTAMFDADRPIAFEDGNGTAASPYRITNEAQLKNVRFFPDAHLMLDRDIVLAEVDEKSSNFSPLFSDSTKFNGVFDGNGHTIKNLAIRHDSTFYAGLFACIGKNGSVKNLNLENARIAGTNYIGGIAGFSQGSITDCSVDGSVSYIQNNEYKVFAGGIAGRADGDIDGNHARIDVNISDSAGETSVGGIVGYSSFNSYNGLVLSTQIKANVKSKNKLYCGGLIGYSPNSAQMNLSACAVSGEIVYEAGVEALTGGLCGSIGRATISECSVSMNFTGINDGGSAIIGGLFGSGSYLTVTDCSASGSVNCEANYVRAGGLVGYSDNLHVNGFNSDLNISVVSKYSDSSVGGIVGYGYNANLISCSTTGKLSNVGNNANIGGLVGKCSIELFVRNSYTVAYVEHDEAYKQQRGAIVGFANNIDIDRTHWLKYGDNDIDYAVGYCESYGVPSNEGSTLHRLKAEFALIVSKLNEGLEKPAWILDVNTGMPVLIALQDK